MSGALNQRRAAPLQTVWVDIPEHALEAYEQALGSVCTTIGFFLDEATGTWRVEGVREAAADSHQLIAALALAAAVSGVDAPLQRADTQAEGWLARTREAFPEQLVGRRFVVRGTHLPPTPAPGRIVLALDAGLAFGSGEHGSTRGCLMALEALARHRPSRVLDLGTGSGILAIAAARLLPGLSTPVLATDIDPWSVRVARENAAANGVAARVRVRLARGWRQRIVRERAPYDLVLANILARPLCAMARDLAAGLAPGGHAVLSGLLTGQVRMVVAAHQRQGFAVAARADATALGDVDPAQAPAVIARNEVTKQSIFRAAVRTSATGAAPRRFQLSWCGTEDGSLRCARNDDETLSGQ